MRAWDILCRLVFVLALVLVWTNYGEYKRRPTEAFEVVAAPIRAWDETAMRSRKRAFVALGTKPCEEVAFPPELFESLNTMVGSTIRFLVERGRDESQGCYGWSASYLDKPLLGISTQQVIQQNEQHALTQMFISGTLAAGAALSLLYRRRRRVGRSRDHA